MRNEGSVPGPAGAKLEAIKAVHTFAWFTIEAAMAYVLYAGLRGRSDRKAAVAGAVVLTETAIFRPGPRVGGRGRRNAGRHPGVL